MKGIYPLKKRDFYVGDKVIANDAVRVTIETISENGKYIHCSCGNNKKDLIFYLKEELRQAND